MKTPNDIENMSKKTHSEYVELCAKNNYGLISHGFIYKVTNGFTANLTRGIYIKDNEIMKEKYEEKDFVAYPTKYIKEGSLIEFRYEYDAHCRDVDNDYWRIDKSILALCCEPFAKIKEEVRFNNKHNLKEILDDKLYIEMEK